MNGKGKVIYSGQLFRRSMTPALRIQIVSFNDSSICYSTIKSKYRSFKGLVFKV